jgi:2-methylcitrate dehydratase
MGAAPDETLAALIDYVRSRVHGAAEPEPIVRRLVDSFACAIGALASGPPGVARRLAARTLAPTGCSVLGLADRAAPEAAIFANTAAVRYLDYNDYYPGSGHPSDMIPALLAGAELCGADGRSLLLAIDVAYEVAIAIGERNRFRDGGFDQGAHIAAGIAAGLGILLRLPAPALANALAIAVTTTMPMRVTRTGELSDWKGVAIAAAARNGYLATQLATLGMSGPPRPFDGIDGLDRHAPPRGPIVIAPPGPSALERTGCKLFPVEANGQSTLYLLAQMRRTIDVEAIVGIDIETYHRSWHEIGGGQGDHDEKWDPQTRETADHSLPYLVAVMLVDGRVDEASFALPRLRDPALRPLLKRISIAEAPDLTVRYPAERRSRVAIRLADGRVLREETSLSPGDSENPFTDADVDGKYELMRRFAAPRDMVLGLRTALRAMPYAADMSEVTRHMRGLRAASWPSERLTATP